MTWVINEFLMNCGEQPIYNSYLELLPEEILQLIYRFVNKETIRLLSSYDYYDLLAPWADEYSNIDPLREKIDQDQVLINGYKIKKLLYGINGTNMNAKRHLFYKYYGVEEFCREYPNFEIYTYKGVSFKLQQVYTDWIRKDKKEYMEVSLRYENNNYNINKKIYILPENTRAKNNSYNLEDYEVKFYTKDVFSWKSISQE